MTVCANPQSSPLISQYLEIKAEYPDAFVFFQVGDFYELFFHDAQEAAHLLGITLTKRGTYQGKDIPLCGVPLHTASHYYLKLVNLGKKVVLCDQTEIAQPGKLVNRAVAQVITPATIIHEQGLPEKQQALMLFVTATHSHIILVAAEFLTQHLTLIPVARDRSWQTILYTELEKHTPREIIVHQEIETEILKFFHTTGYTLQYHLPSSSPDVPTLSAEEKSYSAGLALALSYLKKYAPDVEYTKSILYPAGCLWLDASSQKHLELLQNTLDGTSEGTLYNILDLTATSMGSRLLRSWISYPLKDLLEITARHETVKELLQNWQCIEAFFEHLKSIGDLERVMGRIRLQRGTYLDFQRLLKGLKSIKELKNIFHTNKLVSPLLIRLYKTWGAYEDLAALLEHFLYPETPPSAENFIRPEADEELQRLDQCVRSSAQILLSYEEEEQKRTGIPSLKVRSTPLYGYVLEITKIHTQLVPADYVRVQTLTNKERYAHSALKVLEYDIVNAQDAYKKRDQELFDRIVQKVYEQSSALMQTARALASFDVLLAFAKAAQKYNYTEPLMNSPARECHIKNGKHPVVSARLGHEYVPNSLHLHETEKTWIITGPNMGGKSTFMRQSALICLMAQIGSWVPAESAHLPVLEALFTRIGASDFVMKGKSTFYVEMEETALICALANERSMVVLDEIGRGTSTYDGMALAYAIIKYIHTEKKPFLLCATHYHELADLFKKTEHLAWYHAAIHRDSKTGEVVLLHTIKRGNVHSSMGIEVAKRVGLPKEIIACAEETKHLLEHAAPAPTKQLPENKSEEKKCADCTHICSQLKHINMDDLSPKQAHAVLEKLSKLITYS